MRRSLQIAALLSLATFARAQTNCVSVDALGTFGDGDSGRPSLSADGRFVAFTSKATNLVVPDANGSPDIFVKDMSTGAVVRASISTAGIEGDSYSIYPSMAADGRTVAYSSHADNLVPGDVNGAGDIFVRDLALGVTELVSVASNGTQGNYASRGVAISADGRFVAFTSNADTLVPGDLNSEQDIFVRDRLLGTTLLASLDSAGNQGNGLTGAPSISGDGRIVVFVSASTNLVAGDTNDKLDVFVHDMLTGQTERASVSSAGLEGDGHSGFVHNTGYHYTSMSPDGRFVVYPSYSSNLVDGDTNGYADVFVHDRVSGTTRRASVNSHGVEADGHSTYPVIYGNGRFVSFSGAAANLAVNDVNGVDDVFVHDFDTGATVLVSTDSQGVRGDLGSAYPAVSADGTVIAYESFATNLVAQDTNDLLDTFVVHVAAPIAPSVYCTSAANSQGCATTVGWTGSPSLSSTTPFSITADSVLNRRPGLLIYGHGATNQPFLGGTLCVAPPIVRSSGVNSGGTPAPALDCSGQLSFDFNARIQQGTFSGLELGVEIFAQYWSRDPLAPSHAHLTAAVRFTIGP